jgi:plastocyanin
VGAPEGAWPAVCRPGFLSPLPCRAAHGPGRKLLGKISTRTSGGSKGCVTVNTRILSQRRQLRRLICPISLEVLLFCLLAQGAVRAGNEPPISVAEVTMRVRVLDSPSGHPAKDQGGVVVWLEPVVGTRQANSETSRPHYRMFERNKMFEPHLLVVPAGSSVDFFNLDPWFHAAFSVSRGNRFDLGLYRRGTRETVTFDRLGVSYVFCRLHPHMAAVVLVVGSPYFGISDGKGRVLLGNVPRGKYLLHVWQEDARRPPVELRRSLLVVGSKRPSRAFSIVVDGKTTDTSGDEGLPDRTSARHGPEPCP